MVRSSIYRLPWHLLYPPLYVCLCLCLSVSVCLTACPSVFVCLPTTLSVCNNPLSINVRFFVSVFNPFSDLRVYLLYSADRIYNSLAVRLSFYICLTVHLSLPLCLCFSVSLSLSLSLYVSLALSLALCLSVCLSRCMQMPELDTEAAHSFIKTHSMYSRSTHVLRGSLLYLTDHRVKCLIRVLST